MKQTLTLAAFAFLVAVASSTWFVTKVMPPRGGPVADGARPGAGPKPVVLKKSAPAAKPRGVAVDSARPVATKEKPAENPVGVAVAKRADKSVDAAALEAEAAARAKSVAKILAQMKPKSAVDIMAKLTDDEVERILRQLNAKQVAALLAVLPDERAASMSRRLLDPRTGREGGSR